MTSFLKKIKKKLNDKNEYIQLIEDEIKTTDYIDTGNIMLNFLISSKKDKGIPNDKIIEFAGPASTGKTFIMLEIFKQAQKKGYDVVLFDTEWANDVEILRKRGLDLDKILVIPVDTVESLKTQILTVLDDIEVEKNKVIIGIDSLGNLTTIKELSDSSEGKDKKDMTRASQIKSLFRTITLKAGIKQTPIIVLNHTYTNISSFIPSNTISGGSGAFYNPSIIIELNKSQDKDGSEIKGIIVSAKSIKNRFAKERMKVKFKIGYSKGIERYSGLFDFCLENNIFKKEGKKIIFQNKEFTKKDFENESFCEELLNSGGLNNILENLFSYQNDIDFLKEENEEEE